MKRWKIWTGITVVFLAGICIGAVGSGLYARHVIRSILDGGPPAVTKLVVEKLTCDLDLSSAQQVEVARIVGDTQSQLQELRLRNRPEIERILSDGMDRMKGVLSAGQWEKLDTGYRRFRARWGTRGRKIER